MCLGALLRRFYGASKALPRRRSKSMRGGIIVFCSAQRCALRNPAHIINIFQGFKRPVASQRVCHLWINFRATRIMWQYKLLVLTLAISSIHTLEDSEKLDEVVEEPSRISKRIMNTRKTTFVSRLILHFLF